MAAPGTTATGMMRMRRRATETTRKPADQPSKDTSSTVTGMPEIHYLDFFRNDVFLVQVHEPPAVPEV